MPTSVANKTISESTSFFGNIVDKAPTFFLALIIIIVFWFLGTILRGVVLRKLGARNTEDHTALLIAKITRIGMLVIGMTIALKLIGIDIVALVGLFGLGIGFAVQDVLKNFLAGMMIIIQEPFKIGDLIQVKEYLGVVESIENRATYIKTLDGQRVIIPNADVYNNSVTNFSAHPERRVTVEVGVEYKTDLALAAETIINTLKGNPQVLKFPEPQVFFDEFADSSINLSARFWIDIQQNFFEMKSVLLQQIKHSLDEVHISIPFPIRTIQIDRGGEIDSMLSKKTEKTTPPEIHTNEQTMAPVQTSAIETTPTVTPPNPETPSAIISASETNILPSTTNIETPSMVVPPTTEQKLS